MALSQTVGAIPPLSAGSPRRSTARLALSSLCRGGLALLLAIVGAYVASPLWTAYQLKHAITVADTDVLQRKIEWDSVRSSFRRSLQAEMLGIDPAAEAQGARRHGFWHRIKLSLGERAVDAFIDTYMTPEGLPLIARYRNAFGEQVKQPLSTMRGRFGIASSVTRSRLGLGIAEAAGPSEPVKPFWQRIERAAFTAIDRFQIELTHPDHPGKLIVSELALRGDEWKLVNLTLKPQAGSASARTDD